MSEDKKTTSPQIEYIKAIIAFRANLIQPVMNATNPFFKNEYIDLGGVTDCIDKQAGAFGLTYQQHTKLIDGFWGVETTVMHVDGYTASGFYILPSTGKSQELGAAVTYAKRYALCTAFGIVADKDDDGNSATQPAKKPQPVIKQPTKEQNEMFGNYKARIKECKTTDDLSAFWKAAYNSMKSSLPDSYFKELEAKKDEMKQFLTKGE